MRYVCMFACVTLFAIVGLAQPAFAIKPFYDVFKKEYLDTQFNLKFVEEVTKPDVKCLICHQGKNKKHRNVFGEEVGKLLDKKKDAKDVEKITASLKKAVEMHTDPKNDKSETYADRIKAGKWPGGELEALKKDPEKSDDKPDDK